MLLYQKINNNNYTYIIYTCASLIRNNLPQKTRSIDLYEFIKNIQLFSETVDYKIILAYKMRNSNPEQHSTVARFLNTYLICV